MLIVVHACILADLQGEPDTAAPQSENSATAQKHSCRNPAVARLDEFGSPQKRTLVFEPLDQKPYKPHTQSPGHAAFWAYRLGESKKRLNRKPVNPKSPELDHPGGHGTFAGDLANLGFYVLAARLEQHRTFCQKLLVPCREEV